MSFDIPVVKNQIDVNPRNVDMKMIAKIKSLVAKGCMVLVLICALVGGKSFGDDCYMGSSGLAVLEPYMMQRACFLYAHHVNAARLLGAAVGTPYTNVLDRPELGLDPLEVAFLQLVEDKKILSLAAGTQVFNCHYDLALIKKSLDEALMKGADLPRSSCGGGDVSFQLVSVRLVNMNTCYWVAEHLVRCGEQIDFHTTPYTPFGPDFWMIPRSDPRQ